MVHSGFRRIDLCVSSTSFQKNDIGWPRQPPTEGVSDVSWKLDFWWSIPQKRTSIGNLGPRDDQKCYFSLISDTPSVGGCWGQPMSFFWKLVDETQISAPPEATRHHRLKNIGPSTPQSQFKKQVSMIFVVFIIYLSKLFLDGQNLSLSLFLTGWFAFDRPPRCT